MGQLIPMMLPTPAPPSDTVHAARLTVCGHALDVEDARLLLDMIGLLDAQ